MACCQCCVVFRGLAGEACMCTLGMLSAGKPRDAADKHHAIVHASGQSGVVLL